MTAEAQREFFDTNVLVYAHDTSAAAKRSRAIELLERAARERTAAVSVQVLQEFFVTVTRRLPVSLPATDAAAIIADLSLIPTHTPTATDVLAAIEIQRSQGVSFWDAMVIRSASQLRCGVLWSEDLADGQTYEGVTVRNPFRDN